MAKPKLTPRQQAFCAEYLIDLNGAAAARRAGYSKKGADVRGAELLGNRKVQVELQKLMGTRARRTQIDADAVLTELGHIGFSQIVDLVEWNHEDGVQVKDSEALAGEPILAAIAEIQEGSSTIGAHASGIKIKLHDKIRALELIGRHLGLFNKTQVVVELEEGAAALAGLLDDYDGYKEKIRE